MDRIAPLMTLRFWMVVLVGLLVLALFGVPAIAQAVRPTAGLPDNTGPDVNGDLGALIQSGRFISLLRGLSSLGEIDDDLPGVGEDRSRRHFSVRVPRHLTEFAIWIFDGDTRRRPGGNISWDNCRTAGCEDVMDEVKYTLFRDPSGPWLDSQIPPGQAPAANSNPLTIANTCAGGTPAPSCVFLGADMPDNRWVGFVVQQDPEACGNILAPEAGEVAGDACGYHLVKEWIPGPGGTLLRHEQANFKVGVGGVGVEIFVFDQSNLGYIGYNGFGASFPGPTSFDGSFTFSIRVNIPTEPTIFSVLLDGDFDVAMDNDDPNFQGVPPFPSINALPEGAMLGDPADDSPFPNPFGEWTTPEAPNPIYSVTAPGGVWEVTNLNPSGDNEWEEFVVGTSAAPAPLLDAVVPSIPNGDYTLNIKGVDARNTIFVTFKAPASPDPTGQILPPTPDQIPTLGEGGMIVLTVSIVWIGIFSLRRRRKLLES